MEMTVFLRIKFEYRPHSVDHPREHNGNMAIVGIQSGISMMMIGIPHCRNPTEFEKID